MSSLISTFCLSFLPWFFISLAGGYEILKSLQSGLLFIKLLFLPFWGLSFVFNYKYGILPDNNTVDSILFWPLFLGLSIFMIIHNLDFGLLGIIGIALQIALIVLGMGLLSILLFRIIRGRELWKDQYTNN